MAPTMLVQLTVADLEDLIERKVRDALSVSGQPTAAQRLVNKAELAQALSCSVATVDRMVNDRMPFVTVGRTRRFDIEACRAWCVERTERPAPAPDSDSTGGIRCVSRGIR